jgi:hypothetical protein
MANDKELEEQLTAPSPSAPALSNAESKSDWFLRTLVKLANMDAFGADITLSVGGVLIAGRLVPGKDYFENFGRYVAASAGNLTPEMRKVYREIMSEIGDRMYPPDSDKDPASAIGFIHLENARVFMGSNLVPAQGEGVWYRVRIDRVDAFTMGTLVAERSG